LTVRKLTGDEGLIKKREKAEEGLLGIPAVASPSDLSSTKARRGSGGVNH